MIITVTMNPCIDRMVTVEKFTYGGMNRIIESREDASGKGINVAIACKQLGGEAVATGINYTGKGRMIRNRLDGLGIPHDFVEVSGDVRVNLKIFDASMGVVTEVNEPGHPVDPAALEALKSKLKALCEKGDMIVFSGSVPKGVSAAVYLELMSAVTGHARLVLDAEGELLTEGLKARPFMIKPNLYELEKALGREFKDQRDIVAGARKFIDAGVSIVGVSMGDKGAVLVDSREAYYSPALPVKVRSTVGAGDSMVAAFCLACEAGAGLEEMLRMGSAAAAATVISDGTQLCSRNGFDFLLPQAAVAAISI